ncbi:FecCD family ABC transporter permease [Glycomyces tritici]|uniref:Iron ABC transporter permease n=1 Tax=Glycomyces tritici TaxID=2665176 RepID=A0ABT7YK63_9ACTN|nr:iron ABC transporter permease [Glycomyces tritici]MDN3239024.1 iron ABC transporter permease [Glycomyces tritici]MDN3240186.1 iron ABC transporter permease [Glycomyces tritici]
MPVARLRPARTARGARNRALPVGASAIALGLIVIASLAIGARDLTPVEVWHGLTRTDAIAAAVVWEQRVPRTAVGLLAGAGLAVAGVLMQTLTRNPLADPRIFGVAAGASLGVVIGLSVLGLTGIGQYVWLGIAGALAAGLIGYAVSTVAARNTGGGTVTYALCGAALDASLSAMVYAVLATDVHSFDQYRFWAVGSLAGRDAEVAWGMAPFLLGGLVLALLAARGMDGLQLGAEAAAGLGHRVGLTRATAAVTVALLTGAAVAAAGPIGFIGLAIPHLARWAVGASHRAQIALSLMLGPCMLLTADVIGRVIVPGEAPAGIICAVIGAPLLIVLVRRARQIYGSQASRGR